ncbi:hypothetical protein NESM_000320300 [Novymonas esmeraldas]|uniref:Uncharacterized protein n=1 Tax=Novymonas esmeraldas TaxID=1808958 RepID=A0AAW0EK96_9TRYP
MGLRRSPSRQPLRRSAAAASDCVRALLASVPASEATTAAATAEEAAPSSAAAPADTAVEPGPWVAQLAQLLHGVCLVSLTEKAQLGAIRRGPEAPAIEATGLGVAAPAPGGSLAAAPLSVSIEHRWMEAVTRYCRRTCTLDDVARVAMAFPAFVLVRWSLKPSPHGSALAYADVDDRTRDAVKADPLTVPRVACTSAGGSLSPPGGVLQGRLYVSAGRVVSAADAEAHLRGALARMGTTAAQRAWCELVKRHTAYAAFAAANTVATAGQRARGLDCGDAAAGSQPTAGDFAAVGTGAVAVGEATTPECGAREEEEEEELLLQQLSAELRASLSGPMLQALLSQMRRDAAHADVHERRRTAEELLSERVVSAYAHVRTLLGGRHGNGCSAATLLRHLREEGRFADAVDPAALLSRLLCIETSGLTATVLRDGEVELTPSPSASAVELQKGARVKSARGKRRRDSVPLGESAVPAVRLTEPSLQRVTDIREMSEEQLQLVRVQLDRGRSSIKAVAEAIASATSS